MALADQVNLEYWFSDLDKKIGAYDIEMCIAEIQFRAMKDGLPPDTKEVLNTIRGFEAAVKAHNKPFVLLGQQDELLAKYRKQLAILDGKKQAKSASQRAFVARAKGSNAEALRRDVVAKIDKLEAEKNASPAYLLNQKQVLPPQPATHPQISVLPDKPDWVRVECAGGCGRHLELRVKKLSPATYYVCDSVASGRKCEASLPPSLPGQITSIEFNAAAHFKGMTYKWPTPAEAESVARAQNILAAGLTQLAIEQAKRQVAYTRKGY
jgi:hypothetical protein